MDKEIEYVELRSDFMIKIQFRDGSFKLYELIYWLNESKRTGTIILPPD